MGRKVTNVNHGTVGMQVGGRDHDTTSKNTKSSKGRDKDNTPESGTKNGDSEVTNVNHGTVGIQAGTVTGNVVINGKKR